MSDLNKALGAIPAMNRVNVINTKDAGSYAVSVHVTNNNFSNNSYLQGGQVNNIQNTNVIGIKAGWYMSNGKYRYMKDSGNDAKAEWVAYKGNWYYLDSDEYMVTDWKRIENKWFYFEPGQDHGEMVVGWREIKGLWYYFKEEESAGYMVVGWREIKGKWYYFKTEAEASSDSDYGYMYSLKWLKYKGSWYYFNKKGEMVTSELITWNGNKYYLKSDGIMAINEIIWDSKTKKSYKADKNGVCREVKNGIITIALKNATNFVKIVDGSLAYYGGDQAWYEWTADSDKTNVARNGGCGTVAAANIVAYLARNNSTFKGLYAYSDYTKANFILHMKDMYEYVTPRSIGSNPLGVWPISMLENGVEQFAGDRGIDLNAVRKSEAFTRDNVIEYITEGLEKDSPIALLVGTKTLNNVTIVKFDGSSWTQDISMHWVTVTELNIDEANDTVKMKISTWGGWAEIDLDEYLGELVYAGLLYFE